MEVVASLSQGRTAAAQCGLFTHKSVPVIFEPPCISASNCILHSHSVISYLCFLRGRYKFFSGGCPISTYYISNLLNYCILFCDVDLMMTFS